MGHRKNRKRQRRNQDWDQAAFPPTDRWRERAAADADLLALMSAVGAAAPPPTTRRCGGCHEFIEDQEGGRGTCLHPGSGVLSPWIDTEGCAFFQAHRGARAELRRG